MKNANRLWRNSNDESGQALVLGAIAISMLMGVMALAVDVGYIHYRQVQLQTAADAAAVAAGLEIGDCKKAACGDMKTAATQALIEDGITTAAIAPATNQCTISNSAGLAMIVNVGPCVLGTSDPNNGNTNMAEVVLTEPQGTFFGIFAGIGTFHLVARAEAGEAYLLDTGGGNCVRTNKLTLDDSGNLTLNNCGLYDGGPLATYAGAKTTATTFLYNGTWSPNKCNGNSCKWTLGNSETQPTHTNNPQSDPLANLTAPTQPAISTTNTQTPAKGVTLQPGYYPSGFNLGSSYTVYLTPGLYYMGGGVNVGNGANLYCTGCTGGAGVTLYFSSGSFDTSSGADVELTAPTAAGAALDGGVANMLIWNGPNAANMLLQDGSRSYYNGVIYLPDNTLEINPGSGSSMNASSVSTAVDVNNFIVDSGDHFVVNGSGGYLGGSGPTLGAFALAE